MSRSSAPSLSVPESVDFSVGLQAGTSGPALGSSREGSCGAPESGARLYSPLGGAGFVTEVRKV